VQGRGNLIGTMFTGNPDQSGTVLQNFKPLAIIALQMVETGGCLATFQDPLDPMLDACLVVIAEPVAPQIRVRDLAWRVGFVGRGRKVRGNPLAAQLGQMPHQAGFELDAALGLAEEAGLDEGDGEHGLTPGMRGLSAGKARPGKEVWENGDQAPGKIRPRSRNSASPPSGNSSG
jgi:hypothetical protein